MGIKAEVFFDEHEIQVNKFIIGEAVDGSIWYVNNEELEIVAQFTMLEQAIKYCLEN